MAGLYERVDEGGWGITEMEVGIKKSLADLTINEHNYAIRQRELAEDVARHKMKIKDRESGGSCTMLGEPLRFDFNNGLGFTIGGINPLKNTENYG